MKSIKSSILTCFIIITFSGCTPFHFPINKKPDTFILHRNEKLSTDIFFENDSVKLCQNKACRIFENDTIIENYINSLAYTSAPRQKAGSVLLRKNGNRFELIDTTSFKKTSLFQFVKTLDLDESFKPSERFPDTLAFEDRANTFLTGDTEILCSKDSITDNDIVLTMSRDDWSGASLFLNELDSSWTLNSWVLINGERICNAPTQIKKDELLLKNLLELQQVSVLNESIFFKDVFGFHPPTYNIGFCNAEVCSWLIGIEEWDTIDLEPIRSIVKSFYVLIGEK